MIASLAFNGIIRRRPVGFWIAHPKNFGGTSGQLRDVWRGNPAILDASNPVFKSVIREGGKAVPEYKPLSFSSTNKAKAVGLPGIHMTNDDWTIEFDFYAPSYNNPGIFLALVNSGGNSGAVVQSTTTGGSAISIAKGSNGFKGVNIPTPAVNVWHHVIAQQTAATESALMIDGVRSAAASTNDNVTASELWLGLNPFGGGTQGVPNGTMIGFVRIWHSYLTFNEQRMLFQNWQLAHPELDALRTVLTKPGATASPWLYQRQMAA